MPDPDGSRYLRQDVTGRSLRPRWVIAVGRQRREGCTGVIGWPELIVYWQRLASGLGGVTMRAASVRPVALGFELLGEILHLVRQNPLLGQEMPFVSVGPEWHSEKRHVRFFRRMTILEPVTALAGSDHVLPLIVPTPGDR